MKKYEVLAVLNGNDINIRKHFKTRQKAIDYMIHFYEKNNYCNFQIEDIYEIKKHEVVYVENDYNKFIVNRIHA